MHHACVPILLTFAGSPQQAGPLLKILRDVKPSNLYIAVGKSRPSSQGDTELFKGLRREIEVDWTCQVHWYAQYDGAEHGGLIDAATWFFSQVEEGIVVDEANLPDSSFFAFCTELLSYYRQKPQIFGISGKSFLAEPNFAASYYFLRTLHSGAWASWRDRWSRVQVLSKSGTKPSRINKSRIGVNEHRSEAFAYSQSSGLATLDELVAQVMARHNLLGIHPTSNLVSRSQFGDQGGDWNDASFLGQLFRPAQSIVFPISHPAFIEPAADFEAHLGERNALAAIPQTALGVANAMVLKSYTPSMVELLMHQFSSLPVLKPLEPIASIAKATKQAEALARQSVEAYVSVSTSDAPPPVTRDDPNLALLLAMDGKEFISAAYSQVLHRTPDQEGETYFAKRLADGYAKQQILGQIAASGETGTAIRLSRRLRWSYLMLRVRRLPILWLCGDIFCAIAGYHIDELLFSNDAEFVIRAYRAILGRAPDEVSIANHLHEIQHGKQKRAILVALYRLPEARSMTNQVAGLATWSLLYRMRQTPIISQLLDILSLPWVAVAALQSSRSIEAAVHSFQSKIVADILVIKQSIQRADSTAKERDANSIGQLQSAAAMIAEKTQAIAAELRETRAFLAANIAMADQSWQDKCAVLSAQIEGIGEAQSAFAHGLESSALGILDSIVDAKAQLRAQSVIVHSFGASWQDKCAALSAQIEGINEAQSAFAHALERSTGEVIESIVDAKAQLALQLEALGQIGNATSEAIADARALLLGRLALAERTQEQLRLSLGRHATEFASRIGETRAQLCDQLAEQIADANNKLSPQFDRIELYCMAAAGRIAVRCGSSTVMIRTAAGYILCSDEDHALIATLVETGDLEPGTRILIERLIGPGSIFIDVGANIGMHTLTAARAMKGRGRILAIEPFAQTALLLEKSIWMNGYGSIAAVHQVAATNGRGQRKLYLGATSGHHSLYPLPEETAFASDPVTVKTITIDKLSEDLPRVDLVKVDVEGAEIEVIASAKGLLQRSPDIGLIVEFGRIHLRRTGINTIDWIDSFTRHGFEHRSIDPITGALHDISVEMLDKVETINLLFARPQSPVWKKVDKQL